MISYRKRNKIQEFVQRATVVIGRIRKSFQDGYQSQEMNEGEKYQVYPSPRLITKDNNQIKFLKDLFKHYQTPSQKNNIEIEIENKDNDNSRCRFATVKHGKYDNLQGESNTMDETIGQLRQIAGAKIDKSNFMKMPAGDLNDDLEFGIENIINRKGFRPGRSATIYNKKKS